MGLLLLLLLCFLCALAHATGEVWDVCVCVRVEREEQWCGVVVSQISGGDGVSMCVVDVEERDEEGEGGRRGDEGWCVPAGCAVEGEGMNELPPSLLPLCRFTCHLHGAVTERVCDLGWWLHTVHSMHAIYSV